MTSQILLNRNKQMSQKPSLSELHRNALIASQLSSTYATQMEWTVNFTFLMPCFPDRNGLIGHKQDNTLPTFLRICAHQVGITLDMKQKNQC